MRDRILLVVSVVTDDSTGIWDIGELEFGIKPACLDYLNQESGNSDKLAGWLEMLAQKCRARQTPFKG